MKIKCSVVEDLLPLYIDNICSEESRELVEEHLGECEACSARLKAQRDELIVSEDVIQKNLKSKEPFKKIKRNGTIRLFSVVLCLILISLTIAEVTGDGVGFSTLIERYRASRVLNLIEDGNFEKASEYLRFDGGIYESISNKEEARKQWISGMQELKKEGIEIISHSKNRIKTEDRFNSGYVNISVKYKDETYPLRVQIYTNSGKVEFGYTVHSNNIPTQTEVQLVHKITTVLMTYFPG